jgi:hypothetical protein
MSEAVHHVSKGADQPNGEQEDAFQKVLGAHVDVRISVKMKFLVRKKNQFLPLQK